MLKEFKEFALKGSVMDMAVGQVRTDPTARAGL
jgi:large-conductance mechanosensitive channel